MIGVTLFGVFMTPVFFYVIRRFTGPGESLAALANIRFLSAELE